MGNLHFLTWSIWSWFLLQILIEILKSLELTFMRNNHTCKWNEYNLKINSLISLVANFFTTPRMNLLYRTVFTIAYWHDWERLESIWNWPCTKKWNDFKPSLGGKNTKEYFRALYEKYTLSRSLYSQCYIAHLSY